MLPVKLPSGKYVLAVSGGVDSVVLLDVLTGQSGSELTVAHFDHGIRSDSAEDAAFVQGLAEKYGLKCVTERAELGAGASEEAARKARYRFLRRVAQEEKAVLVTAHHQDDVLETAIINLMRGTGWRGLCSLRDGPDVRRPLLETTKREIVAYAKAHHLTWREDATNQDRQYLRNRIRNELLPKTNQGFRREMGALTARQGEIREEIEKLVEELLRARHEARGTRHERGGSKLQGTIVLLRAHLNILPTSVAKELLLAILYKLTNRSVEQHMLNRIVWFTKTARPHKTLQVNARTELYTTKATIVVAVK